MADPIADNISRLAIATMSSLVEFESRKMIALDAVIFITALTVQIAFDT